MSIEQLKNWRTEDGIVHELKILGNPNRFVDGAWVKAAPFFGRRCDYVALPPDAKRTNATTTCLECIAKRGEGGLEES